MFFFFWVFFKFLKKKNRAKLPKRVFSLEKGERKNGFSIGDFPFRTSWPNSRQKFEKVFARNYPAVARPAAFKIWQKTQTDFSSSPTRPWSPMGRDIRELWCFPERTILKGLFNQPGACRLDAEDNISS